MNRLKALRALFEQDNGKTLDKILLGLAGDGEAKIELANLDRATRPVALAYIEAARVERKRRCKNALP
jgi:hypothetical protein